MFSLKIYYKVLMFFNLFGLVTNNSISHDWLETNILSSFPTPGPSPQGLGWDGAFLYLSDDSTDTIYKIDPNDGSVIVAFPSPGPEPKGLTSDTTHIWSLDDSLRCIYQLDKETGAVIDSLSLPAEVNYSPTKEFPFHGLLWDGQYFYTNFEAGWSSKIVRIDVKNDTVYLFTYTHGFSKDLAYDGHSIWNCSNSGSTRIGWVSQYDFDTGLRLERFDTPGFYPTGLTHDGTHFWLSDENADSLYQIQVIQTGVEDYHSNNYYGISGHILNQNYPNPFNLYTKIRYTLSKSSFVTLKVYDLIGNELEILVKEYKQASDYELTWNAKNLPSGIYLCRLEAGDFIETKKFILQR